MKSPHAFVLAALFTVSLPLSSRSAEALPGTWRGQSIAEFEGEGLEPDWRIVNDGVMGGLSKGAVDLSSDGMMIFSGTLSLENNGGFSLVESREVKLDLSDDLGILVRVKGDGRTYEMRLKSDARFQGQPVSFSGTLPTVEGEWQQVKIPFSEFRGGWRGRDLPEEVLNPAAIQQMGIMIADKNPGSFELEVDWIRTFGKGQGSGEVTEAKVEKSATPAPEEKNLIARIESDGRFTTLKSALDAAGLTLFFQWDNPLTVLAPTDEAFEKLPDSALESLLKPENKQRLVEVLSRHVTPGNQRLTDALDIGNLAMVKGETVSFRFSEGRVRADGATLIDADIECSDGVIHVIDAVLLAE